jgi:hypothetical protein
MKNVKTSIKGNKLTIEVDLDQTQGPSKSGKNQIIATTGGNVVLDGGVKLGLNVFK